MENTYNRESLIANLLICLWISAGNLLPGEVDRVAIGGDLDDLAIDRDGIFADRLDVCVKDAEGRVVLEEVGGLLDTAGVVNDQDVERGVLPSMPAPQEIPSNPTEPIDRHLQLLCSHH